MKWRAEVGGRCVVFVFAVILEGTALVAAFTVLSAVDVVLSAAMPDCARC